MTMGADGILYVKCSKCQKPYEKLVMMQRHELNCKGFQLSGNRLTYRCFECGKRFIQKIKCAEHLASVHNIIIKNVKKYCFTCKAEFEDIFRHARSHNCPHQCQEVRNDCFCSRC